MRNTVQTEPIDVRGEEFADFMADYPYASEVDSIYELPEQVFTANDEGEPFTARVLGFGSSYRESHLDHPPGSKPGKGVRCSGCRWTDTAIMWSGESALYVFVSLGKSALEGEWQRNTVIWTSDPAEVLRKCFVPTKQNFRRDTGDKAIPPHNAMAFREAASVDSQLADLLERYGDAIPDTDKRGPDADPLAGL